MASTTLEERVDILESSEKGEATWRQARRLGWSQRTIQKWRRRGRTQGRPGLHTQMGRPKSGAAGSFSPELRSTILRWRKENPGWGPTTLLAELQLHSAFAGQKLPSRATIAHFLKQEGLIATRLPAIPLPESESSRIAGQPHQLWELDARGYEQVPDVGIVTLINLNDRYSHARLLSYPCWLGQTRAENHAKTEDYQACLRMAFMDWGLPHSIQVDHESVFYDNRSKSPFPTRFHLWLLALGVSLTFIRVRRPKDQGMTERSHQLWYHQVIQGHTFSEWSSLYAALDSRRTFLNQHLPCRSLGNLPPLVAHPDAIHSGTHYLLGCELDMLDLDRVYNYLTQGRWFRLVSRSGTISLGRQIYYLGAKWQHQQVEITFDSASRSLAFLDHYANHISTIPIKGLSKEYLLGDITDLSRLPSFQMALPFSWAQQQSARLLETIS